MKFNKRVDLNKTKEYIKGYKIDDACNKESIHANNLYDGISIIGDYSMVILIKESISEKKAKIKENIAINYKLFEYTSEIQNFLIENKDELECICKNSMIEKFSLDNLKNKDCSITIKLFDVDLTGILYNGEGIESLETIKKGTWDIIAKNLTEKRIIEIIEKKIGDALSDSYYLEDEDDISMTIMQNYNKINYDRLEKLSNPTIFENKEDILEEVILCMYNYQSKIAQHKREYFSSTASKNFEFKTYLHYMYIEDIYTKLKEEEIKEGEE